MNILLIFGSSRKNGNSAKIVSSLNQHPLNHRFNLKIVYLCDYKIIPCRSCYKCNEAGHCIIDDDVPDIVEEMMYADAIIYMPVIYAFSTNAIFQAFLERSGFGYFRPRNRPLRDKLANAIVIGRRYAHSDVIAQVFMNIYLNEMIIVGSGFPMSIYCYGNFPGDSLLDREGIEAIDKGITRMVTFFYDKLRKESRRVIANSSLHVESILTI